MKQKNKNSPMAAAAIALSALVMLAACDPDIKMSCSESFDLGMRGAWSAETKENKERCAADYEKWLASTPPSEYQVIGRSVKIENKVISLEGMVVERTKSYLNQITDKPQPTVSIKQGNHSAWLRFQDDAQADAAFKEISEAIAGVSPVAASYAAATSN